MVDRGPSRALILILFLSSNHGGFQNHYVMWHCILEHCFVCHADDRSVYLHDMALAIVEGTLRLHPGEEATPPTRRSRTCLGGCSCFGRLGRLDALCLLGSRVGCCSLDLLLSGRDFGGTCTGANLGDTPSRCHGQASTGDFMAADKNCIDMHVGAASV